MKPTQPVQPNQPENIEPVLEAILMTQKQGSEEINNNLEALIAQGEKNNPEVILEAQTVLQNKMLEEISKSKPFKMEIEVNGAEQVSYKGEQGDVGPEPTDDRLIGLIQPLIPQVKDGKDADEQAITLRILDMVLPEVPTIEEVVSQIPIPADGKDGKDADSAMILRELITHIPAPKEGKTGKSGKDGSPDTGKQIVTKLKDLPRGSKLNIKDLDGAPDFDYLARISSKTVSLKELDDVDLTGVTITNGKYMLGSGGGSVGPGTINEIAYFNTATSIASLNTATYPSLTELSYVKGVTSSIQTQLDSKFTLPSLTNGSVLFSNGTTIAQDNANFFYDSTNKRLSIGKTSPAVTLDVASTGNAGLTLTGSNTANAATFTLADTNDITNTSIWRLLGSTATNTNFKNVPNTFALQSNPSGGLILATNSASVAPIIFAIGTQFTDEAMRIDTSKNLSLKQDLLFANGKGIKGPADASSSYALYGYDTLSPGYTAMITITNGGTQPTMNFIGTATIGTAYIYRVGGTDVAVADGGTSFSSYTTGDLIQASAAGTLAKLNAVATGNVLISGGVGVVSSWGKVGLTTHVSGILPQANGGTGFATYAVGDILYADTTSTLAKLADVATGNALISGGVNTAPSWGKIGLTTHVTGTLPVANGGTGQTSLGAVDHNSLGNLTVGDVHTQYAFLAGRASGQTLIGGTAASETLTLKSTSHATKGKVIFGNAGTSAYDEVNERLGVGTATPVGTITAKFSTTDFTNTAFANTHLLLDNPTSSGGQVSIGFMVNGSKTAKWRSDYLGNNVLASYAGSFFFTTGGDTGDGGAVKMSIQNNGNVGIGTGLLGTSANALLSLTSSLANSKLLLYDDGSNFVGMGVQSFNFRFHLSSASDRYSFHSSAAGTELMTLTGGGNLGIGTGSTVSARLHPISTTEQLRLGYDTTNRAMFTVSSTGSLTMALNGTSPGFTFSQKTLFSATVYFTEFDNGNSSTADTIDWTVGNKQKSTLTGNCTFTFTAPPGPCSLVLKLIQDGTGSRTVTWPAAVHWSGGVAPTLTTTLNKVDIITFYWDGTTYFGNASLNYTA